MDSKAVSEYVSEAWEKSVIPTLCQYIAIPNLSPLFDPEWKTNGQQEKAVELMVDWVKKQNVPGLQLKVEHDPGKTPLIFIEVEGHGRVQETVLLYGHLDKQPPLEKSWDAGLGPWKPVIRDGKLYGRGGADDGYAIFAALTAIQALKKQNVPHSRCVIIVEACEESGSFDLPHYVNKLSKDIGIPSLVVCLDSGCGNYKQFWLTTSLRGLVVGNLTVKVLNEGVHSGLASGIVPESFRIVRSLIDRIENQETGQLKVEECFCKIPAKHIKYAKETAETLGREVYSEFPWTHTTKPVHEDVGELCLNRTWCPTLVVTGVDGIPNVQSAGNVLRSSTTVKLSIRLPPTVDGKTAAAVVKAKLEANPPYGAQVTFAVEKEAPGWAAPEMEPWLEDAVDGASHAFFHQPARYMGEGGSIPFMGMLGEKFPGVQFVITGVLGPKSNAHGPNEFLELSMGKNLTCCTAFILARHYEIKSNKKSRHQ